MEKTYPEVDQLVADLIADKHEILKIVQSGARQAIREMAKKAVTARICEKTCDSSPLLKEVRKLNNYKASQKVGDYLLITFNPDSTKYDKDPQSFIKQFKELKFATKKEDNVQWFAITIERHLTGKVHYHIVVNRRAPATDKPIQPRDWRRTFKKFFDDPKNADNNHILNIECSDSGSFGYLCGIKSDKDKAKQEAVKADRQWRRESGLHDLYLWGRGPVGTRYPIFDAAIDRYQYCFEEIRVNVDGAYNDLPDPKPKQQLKEEDSEEEVYIEYDPDDQYVRDLPDF